MVDMYDSVNASSCGISVGERESKVGEIDLSQVNNSQQPTFRNQHEKETSQWMALHRRKIPMGSTHFRGEAAKRSIYFHENGKAGARMPASLSLHTHGSV